MLAPFLLTYIVQDYYLPQQRQEPAALGGGPSRGRGYGPEGACCQPGVLAPRARTRLTHQVPHPPAQPLGSDVDRKLGLKSSGSKELCGVCLGSLRASAARPLRPGEATGREARCLAALSLHLQARRKLPALRRPRVPPSHHPAKWASVSGAGSEDTAGLPQAWEAIEASPSMILVPHGPGAVPSGEQRPRAAASGAGGLRGRRLRVQRAQITWGLVAEDYPCNSSLGH